MPEAGTNVRQAYRIIPELDQWLHWKQWKRARTRRRQLIRLGIHPAEVYKTTRTLVVISFPINLTVMLLTL